MNARRQDHKRCYKTFAANLCIFMPFMLTVFQCQIILEF